MVWRSLESLSRLQIPEFLACRSVSTLKFRTIRLYYYLYCSFQKWIGA